MTQDYKYLHQNKFPNPFYDIASTYIPPDIKKTFELCEHIYVNGGIIRGATSRLVNYFIQKIEYGEETKTTEKLKEFLEKKLKVRSHLSKLGINYVDYGNGIITMYIPFTRYLECPSCVFRVNLSNFKLDYKYNKGKFVGDCPNCNAKNVTFKLIDLDLRNEDKIKVKHLNVHDINIKKNPVSEEHIYYWDLPESLRAGVKVDKDDFYIKSTREEMLSAISKDQAFQIDPKYVFHLSTSIISGFEDKCVWGLPLYLNIIKLNFYQAILRRANEAISMDYLIPLRVISPGQTSSSGDPLLQFSLNNFASKVESAISHHRNDPADYHVFPFPINYNAYGAEKKALDVTPEIRSVIEEQLHSLNYPSEIFYNTLNIQAMPPALRLFEQTWCDLVDGLNNALQWIADNACDFMGWDRQQVSITKVTLAEDIEKRQVMLNLASAQQTSMIDALKLYGMDFKDQNKKLLEQQKILMDLQKDFQSDMESAVQMGIENPAQGANSITDINQQAMQIAAQLLDMPQERRTAEMRNLKNTDPNLHAIVKQNMENTRQTSRTEHGYETLSAAGMTGHEQAPERPNKKTLVFN